MYTEFNKNNPELDESIYEPPFKKILSETFLIDTMKIKINLLFFSFHKNLTSIKIIITSFTKNM
ncbi:MAG: hypothetical protein KatS3mg068_0070 [Candidatus Sericytochromatia bacterium]|nr:MAG: hypothetical protein KatS3mg068_0070 [Candidatus Sericytochromatia bacterium]